MMTEFYETKKGLGFGVETQNKTYPSWKAAPPGPLEFQACSVPSSPDLQMVLVGWLLMLDSFFAHPLHYQYQNTIWTLLSFLPLFSPSPSLFPILETLGRASLPWTKKSLNRSDGWKWKQRHPQLLRCCHFLLHKNFHNSTFLNDRHDMILRLSRRCARMH